MPRLTGIRCQCVACGQWFGAVTTFNRHRRGTYTHEAPHHGRRCLAAAQMTALGWLKIAAGFWIRGKRRVLACTSRAGAAFAFSPLDGGGSERSPLRNALRPDSVGAGGRPIARAA